MTRRKAQKNHSPVLLPPSCPASGWRLRPRVKRSARPPRCPGGPGTRTSISRVSSSISPTASAKQVVGNFNGDHDVPFGHGDGERFPGGLVRVRTSAICLRKAGSRWTRSRPSEPGTGHDPGAGAAAGSTCHGSIRRGHGCDSGAEAGPRGRAWSAPVPVLHLGEKNDLRERGSGPASHSTHRPGLRNFAEAKLHCTLATARRPAVRGFSWPTGRESRTVRMWSDLRVQAALFP